MIGESYQPPIPAEADSMCSQPRRESDGPGCPVTAMLPEEQTDEKVDFMDAVIQRLDRIIESLRIMESLLR